MKYLITKGERAFVLWMVNSIEGVNRTDGRLVASVSDNLELPDVTTVLNEELNIESSHDLSVLESRWILDQIDKSFTQQKVPPTLAKYAFSLEDKLKEGTADKPKEELAK